MGAYGKPTPVFQATNRVLIGHGTYHLVTCPAGKLWVLKYANICNSDLPPLSGSIFVLDASGVPADALVTALALPVLRRAAMMGTWVLTAGDAVYAVINSGNVASCHVAGMVRSA